ncbi:MAG: molybdopterin molybdotransferase MoeA [Candidatus Omnitrophica bacterium]|nr:molybdopterin molybdotransferase MoeA [Candidatus Omnitrophota bacterium]
MISVEEAQMIILDSTRPNPPRRVSLKDSLGLVLAEDVIASVDLPPFTSSAMDGYALRGEDTAQASEESPCRLQRVEDLPAGKVARRKITARTCARIMTGGLLPRGAGAVVMLEETESVGDEIKIKRVVSTGENIRYQGEDVRKGKTVLQKGTAIHAQQVALLAALGFSRPLVFPRPSVAFLSTGNELVPVSKKLSPGKIRDSNSDTLEALLREAGANPVRLGIAKDSRASLRKKIRKGLARDLLLVAGGVSAGTHDLVKEILEAEGVKELFWKVRMKPGKPLFFGKKGKTLVFGLPGNPASSFVSFQLFVRPALRKRMGAREALPVFEKARLAQDLTHAPGRVDFIRAVCERNHGAPGIRSSGMQGSHCLSSLAHANALLRLGENVSKRSKGEEVEALIL